MATDPPSKPKARRLSSEERRAQIIAATIACLARESPERWTLRQVSRDLGVAPSLVNYFFDGWDDLIIAAYRDLADRFRDEFNAIADQHDATPEARLDDYIDRFFSAFWMTDDVAGAYVAFWALARGETALRAEMTAHAETIRETLAPILLALAQARGAENRAESALEALYFLLNGLWSEMAVNPSALSPAAAKQRARATVDLALPPV